MNRILTGRRAVPLLLSATLCAGMPGALAQTAAVVAPAAETALMIITPKNFGADPAFANGCWVRLYDGIGYIGRQLTLVGPIDLPQMTRTGAPWRDWDSAVVGPKARVTTFDSASLGDPRATLAPGLRAPDLRDGKLGCFDEIHSAPATAPVECRYRDRRAACAPSATSNGSPSSATVGGKRRRSRSSMRSRRHRAATSSAARKRRPGPGSRTDPAAPAICRRCTESACQGTVHIVLSTR